MLSQNERYQEEDPYTGSFIEDQEITIIAHDSRYEYDLNRTQDECAYETVWGKEIWKTALSSTRNELTGEENLTGKYLEIYNAFLMQLSPKTVNRIYLSELSSFISGLYTSPTVFIKTSSFAYQGKVHFR